MWKPGFDGIYQSFVPVSLLFFFFRVSRDKSPIPSLQHFAGVGIAYAILSVPQGSTHSVYRGPITLLALTSTVTPFPPIFFLFCSPSLPSCQFDLILILHKSSLGCVQLSTHSETLLLSFWKRCSRSLALSLDSGF